MNLWKRLIYAVRCFITAMPMVKLGAQCQFDSEEMTRYNREIKPKWLLLINVTKREFLERLKFDNPGVKIAYRTHPNTEGWGENPEAAAEAHIDRLKRELVGIWDLIDGLLDNNEFIHAHQDDLHEAADRYIARFIELCVTVLGKKPIVLNAATGNFSDKDIVPKFPRMLAALKQYGGYLGFHEYDWPTMWRIHEEGLAKGDGGMWHCLRWKRAAKAIKAAMGGWCPRFIITECGIDSHVNPDLVGQPHKGWRGTHPELVGAAENFVASLHWYCDNFDDDVEAVIIFGCGMVVPWNAEDGFDIAYSPVIERIAQFPAPPPPPPNGGNGEMDEVRVFDTQGNELFGSDREAMIRRHHGSDPFVSPPPGLQPGDHYYRLAVLRQQYTASWTYLVLDIGGNPVVNLTNPPHLDTSLAHRAWWWPGIDDEANDIETPFPTDREVRADLGELSATGSGSGMGTGSYHDPNTPGPHRAWVRHPTIPSAELLNIGMIGGTAHETLVGQWEERIYGGDGPQPPPGNGGEKMWKETSRKFTGGQEAQIHLHLSGGQKTDYMDIRGDLKCPGWQLPDAVEPKPEGDIGARLEFGCMYSEQEQRTYTAWVFRLPGTTRVSDEVACSFSADPAQRGKWDVYLQWQAEEPPPPSPPPPSPPPSDAVQRLLEICDEIKAIAYSLGPSDLMPTVMELTLKDGTKLTYALTPKSAGVVARLRASIASLVGK